MPDANLFASDVTLNNTGNNPYCQETYYLQRYTIIIVMSLVIIETMKMRM